MNERSRVTQKKASSKKRVVVQKTSSPSSTKKRTVSKKVSLYMKRGTKILLLSSVFQKSVKMMMVAVFIGTASYGGYQLIGTSFANEVVISKSEIISRAGLLTNLPDSEPVEVVRVQDEADLKKQNDFYKDAQEGDYIIVYTTMAVIYDLRNDKIVALRKMRP